MSVQSTSAAARAGAPDNPSDDKSSAEAASAALADGMSFPAGRLCDAACLAARCAMRLAVARFAAV